VWLQAWAALEYLDGAVGKIFDFLKRSGLAKSTYVMLLSDNGSALLQGEKKKVRRQGSCCGQVRRGRGSTQCWQAV
jgi:arylsulfatase A-like enzyme